MLAHLVVWIQVLSEMLPISSSSQVTLLVQWYTREVGSMLGSVVPDGFNYLLHIPVLLVVPIFFRKSWFCAAVIFLRRVVMRRDVSAWSTRIFFLLVMKLLGIVFLATCFIVCIELFVKNNLVFDLDVLRPYGLLVTAGMLCAASLVRIKAFYLRRPWIVLGVVGVIQAAAFFPGISRMGCTIALGLICGMSVRRAFEFSFLLQFPLILAAVIFRGLPWLFLANVRESVPLDLFIHLGVAGLCSYFVLWFALKIFERRLMWVFSLHAVLTSFLLIAMR